SLTPGLRALVTVNTDFAQTQVDTRVVNLTQFSVFFPEVRTFFLEGANFFDFANTSVQQTGNSLTAGFSRTVVTQIVPFFSRRIGLTASGRPQKIDYGTRLIGQAGHMDVGLLYVRTGLDQGVPGEHFGVLRLKERFLKQSYVGAIYTAREQAGG